MILILVLMKLGSDPNTKYQKVFYVIFYFIPFKVYFH